MAPVETGRRSWLAALTSTVLPGWGHLYTGRQKVARVLLLVDLLLIAAAVVTLSWFGVGLMKLTVTTSGLTMLMAGNLALFGYRLLVAADAARSQIQGPAHWTAFIGFALSGILLLTPHAVAGYVIVTQYDLIDSLFPDHEPVTAAPAVTSSTFAGSSTPSLTPHNSTTPASATTTTTGAHFWDGLDRLNVVVLGADAGAGRTGLRTDTTIVLSIEPASGDTVMVSIPRNLSNAPLPDGMGIWECNCFPDLITHLWDAAERMPDAFPGPGQPPINAIKGALGEILDVPIHYYALVNLDGFVSVVDALGGVTINIPATIIDETYPHEDGSIESVVIEAGTQHLDGHLALAYARIRRHSDDFARMHRQRCVVEALVDQSGPAGIVANFGNLAQAIKDNVRTDISRERLVDLVDLIPQIDSDRIAALRIARDYQTGSSPDRTYYDIERIRRDFQALVADPVAAQANLGLDSLHSTCEESYD